MCWNNNSNFNSIPQPQPSTEKALKTMYKLMRKNMAPCCGLSLSVSLSLFFSLPTYRPTYLPASLCNYLLIYLCLGLVLASYTLNPKPRRPTYGLGCRVSRFGGHTRTLQARHMGVSENEGYRILGSLIIRILLFRVLY